MVLTVFITGASSGIGEALARQYAQMGARVGLLGRRPEVLSAIRLSLPNADMHEIYAVDVCDQEKLHAAARHFIANHGVPDVVVAAAGISVGTWTEHFEDLVQFKRIFATNVLAMADTFHPFIAPMKAVGKGQLVGIASVAGIRGLVGSEAYCASKAAVMSYCESLRGALRQTGVKVVTIAPGYVATPLTAANPYQMPFLLQPAEFAKRAIRSIEQQKSYCVIPWQMGVVAKLMRVLPNSWFDALFANKKHKPRVGETSVE